MFRKFLMKSAHRPSENPFETTGRGDDALPVLTEAFDDIEWFHLTDNGSDVSSFGARVSRSPPFRPLTDST